MAVGHVAPVLETVLPQHGLVELMAMGVLGKVALQLDILALM